MKFAVPLSKRQSLEFMTLTSLILPISFFGPLVYFLSYIFNNLATFVYCFCILSFLTNRFFQYIPLYFLLSFTLFFLILSPYLCAIYSPHLLPCSSLFSSSSHVFLFLYASPISLHSFHTHIVLYTPATLRPAVLAFLYVSYHPQGSTVHTMQLLLVLKPIHLSPV